ncbi:MAG: tRNA lysidine(34) synthetase TilS [Planctomycetota bacterium]|nr:MAG: tRNA lysidine(34) synthetase TilS [Planctomycetota bacterium]
MDADAMLQRFAASAQRLLPASGKPLLVAVSGGADSLALLALMVQLRQWPVHIGHIDHGLRTPADAQADQDAIAEMLRQLQADIPVHVRKVAVRDWAQEKRCGIEEAARHLRYATLVEIARDHQASVILTAHHADDQAETILHHLLRGCGPVGQWGMAERRSLVEGVELIRPLLTQTRASCHQFLRQRGLSWHEDVSNSDMTFTRNWLRHQVLPSFESGAPGFTRALCVWAQEQRRAYEPLWCQAQQAMQAYVRDGSALPLEQVQALSLSQRWLLWRALADYLHIAVDRQWCRRCDDLLHGHGGRRYHHGQWMLRRSRSHITWETVTPDREHALGALPEHEAAPVVEGVPVAPSDLSYDPYLATVDRERLDGPLVWRSLRAAERWRPLGAQGGRLVKRGLADRGVPAWQRSRLLVLADKQGVVWIPGWTIAHRVRVDEHTRQALRLHCHDQHSFTVVPTK